MTLHKETNVPVLSQVNGDLFPFYFSASFFRINYFCLTNAHLNKEYKQLIDGILALRINFYVEMACYKIDIHEIFCICKPIILIIMVIEPISFM